MAAATTGTSSRPIAMASWRWRERDQKDRIFLTLSAEYGVGHTGLGESGRTKCATVTAPAWAPLRIRVIAAVGEPVVESQRPPFSDDVGLGEHLKRRVNPECAALNTFCGGERRQLLERRNVFGPAVGIAGVVERVHADEDVACAEHFSPSERERQKYRVPRRDVGRRNFVACPER